MTLKELQKQTQQRVEENRAQAAEAITQFESGLMTADELGAKLITHGDDMRQAVMALGGMAVHAI